MNSRRFFLICALLAGCFGCSPKIEQPNAQRAEFLEVRIRRWTALEGGEVLVLRKIDKDWSAMLLGDNDRFSCLYQKSVQPKSGWDALWSSLEKEGLLEIPDGNYTNNCCTDGNGFDAEIFYQGRLKRFSFFLPEELKTKEAGQIQNVGNVISREFNTPMFVADYSRSEVGDYLMESCKNWREYSGR